MFFKSKSKQDVQPTDDRQKTPGPISAPIERLTSDEVNQTAEQMTPIALDNADVVTEVAASATASPPPIELSQEELQQHSAKAHRTLSQFGSVVSVFMRSRNAKGMTLAQVESLVVPAVVSGQFVFAEAQSKANGMVAPIAAVLWANVSDEVDLRLSSNLDRPVELAPAEWSGGEQVWLMAAAGDQRLVGGLVKKLQGTILKDREIKVRSRDKDGNPTVMTIQASS